MPSRALLCVLVIASAAASKATASVPGCNTPPYGYGCNCAAWGPESQCAGGLSCTGNTTVWGPACCGGDCNVITCPLKNNTDFIEFWIQNTTTDYCANTQIRTCDDENGCVGVKYRNDTSTYLRCAEYGNPTTGHYADGGVSLPTKVRIPGDTKYVTFVCDPEPGVEVPIVSEFWPKANFSAPHQTTWPEAMPPMGKSNCSECTGSDYCPWRTYGPGAECSCCTRCTPDDGTYPPQYNISITNPTGHPWKVQLQLLVGPTGSYYMKPSTCVVRDAFTECDDWRPGHCPTALISEWQESVDPTAATMVPPGVTDFMIGIPPNVASIDLVPMYTSVLATCVVEGVSSGYMPHTVLLTDALGGQDCQVGTTLVSRH